MDNIVKTWADGYGRWHAEAETSRMGMIWAVNAIARELFDRAPRGTTFQDAREYVGRNIVRIPSDQPGRVHFAEYAIEEG